MATNEPHELRFVIHNLAENGIGNIGVKYLTSANFPLLSLISLSNNKIEQEGAYHLSKGYWKKLKTLRLCSFHNIKLITILEIRGFSTFSKEIGQRRRMSS